MQNGYNSHITYTFYTSVAILGAAWFYFAFTKPILYAFAQK